MYISIIIWIALSLLLFSFPWKGRLHFHDHHLTLAQHHPYKENLPMSANASGSISQVQQSGCICCSAQQRAWGPQHPAVGSVSLAGLGEVVQQTQAPESRSAHWPPVLACSLALCSVLPAHNEVLVNFQISGTPVFQQMGKGQRWGCSLRSVIISWKRKFNSLLLGVTATEKHPKLVTSHILIPSSSE